MYGAHRSRVGGSDHRGLRPPAAGGLRSQKAQNQGAQTSWGSDPGWGLRPRWRAQTQGTQIWGAQTSGGLDPGCGLKPLRARNWGAQNRWGSDPTGGSDWGAWRIQTLEGFRPRLGAQTPEGSELGELRPQGAQTRVPTRGGSDLRRGFRPEGAHVSSTCDYVFGEKPRRPQRNWQ